MTVRWREQGAGVVILTPAGIGAVRLFGLPFAAAGFYFLYQFLDGETADRAEDEHQPRTARTTRTPQGLVRVAGVDRG